ncbi:zinc finger protein 37 [Cydia fagiglandana]|uniref:zinc finger protein 37 n=1 Tax=Cydia fagiglandana TaxID=1458189 RepID=UPI002FEDE89F
MAELESLNPDSRVGTIGYISKIDVELNIKTEVEIRVKPEPHECVTCSSRGRDGLDIYNSNTASGISLYDFLYKFTRVDLSAAENCPKYMCKTCFELINVLEAAELEYLKLKQAFEDILSRNPLFDATSHPVELGAVKTEVFDEIYNTRNRDLGPDSEDEPLAVTKKKRHRKPDKTKKKLSKNAPKRKPKNADNIESWQCNVCGKKGDTGGIVAEAAHKLAVHSLVAAAAPSLENVKREDSTDGTHSPDYSNGFDTASDSLFKIEMGDFEEDDDDSDNYIPDDISTAEVSRKRARILSAKKRKRREDKVMHQCDQCDLKYSSMVRLQQHKRKHDDSKPPYICEVCGAHYKHKRACDIHVALHKGISDWKCEECNKLFPSKGALHRHNNIHTGKPNYQCDLCGKSFIHTSSFKMHKLSHSGVKPHACDVCGLALMTRSHLKRHKRVHSGEKRHECPICGKRFSERYNLVAHSKSHSGEGAQAPATPATPPPRRRLFRCNFCQERFERRYMLERHVSVVHGRTLERPPPTPRNTMSKMLKAQAQARRSPTHSSNETTTKEEPSPDTTEKIPTSSSAWTNAYVQEFGLRPEYQH